MAIRGKSLSERTPIEKFKCNIYKAVVAFLYLVMLSSLALAGLHSAYQDSHTRTMPSDWRIWMHDAFYPHLHKRDLKVVAQRGKILVITLFLTAGLLALVSVALSKSGKGDKGAVESIDPKELRACAVMAANAGRDGLSKGRREALYMALSAYAKARGIEWEDKDLKPFSSVTYYIGGDRVTVTIPDDSSAVEVSTIHGNLGASAVADTKGGSIRSSIFISHASNEK